MSRGRKARRHRRQDHPLALAHGLIPPLVRQGQALIGYGRALAALPSAALEPEMRDLVVRHLRHSTKHGMQAFHHTAHVLDRVLVHHGRTVLPPPDPYPILSTLALMQRQLVDNLKALSLSPVLDPPDYDPLILSLPVIDWSSFAQSRFQVSPAEGSVIAQFIEGATISQIAKTLSRARETVRTQTRDARVKVASKTGTPVPNINRLVAVVLLTRLRELSGGML